MAHWIKRADMPQVNAEDYPALIEFLQSRKVEVIAKDIPPMFLHFHQEVNWKLLANAFIPPDILNSSILVSSDNGVLDGNHRAAYRRQRGILDCPVLQLSVPFDVALALLFQFSGTYKESRLHIAA